MIRLRSLEKGKLCVMLHKPYTESKTLKEKKANAAPGDFPPVNKESFGLGSGLRHPPKIRIKFLFVNIPAGSLNDPPAHDRPRPPEWLASPSYRFCPLLPRMKHSADRFDTDISRKSELWDAAAQLKHLWRRCTPGGHQRSAVVGHLHRCLGSGWSTQPPSELL